MLGIKYDSIDDLNQSVEEFVRVINVNEERVINAVRNFVESGRAACECDECLLDLLAISLNRTPTRVRYPARDRQDRNQSAAENDPPAGPGPRARPAGPEPAVGR